jgi:site-specific DNA-cytosine methylase
MKALEVFCGTKSVSKALPEEDWEVTSVDLLERFNPTILTDVATWDYQAAFPPGYFDYVHLSPPCTEFSKALTTRPRDLELGDVLAKRSIEI